LLDLKIGRTSFRDLEKIEVLKFEVEDVNSRFSIHNLIETVGYHLFFYNERFYFSKNFESLLEARMVEVSFRYFEMLDAVEFLTKKMDVKGFEFQDSIGGRKREFGLVGLQIEEEKSKNCKKGLFINSQIVSLEGENMDLD